MSEGSELLAGELLAEAQAGVVCDVAVDAQGNAIVTCPDVATQGRVLEAISEHEVRVRVRSATKE